MVLLSWSNEVWRRQVTHKINLIPMLQEVLPWRSVRTTRWRLGKETGLLNRDINILPTAYTGAPISVDLLKYTTRRMCMWAGGTSTVYVLYFLKKDGWNRYFFYIFRNPTPKANDDAPLHGGEYLNLVIWGHRGLFNSFRFITSGKFYGHSPYASMSFLEHPAVLRVCQRRQEETTNFIHFHGQSCPLHLAQRGWQRNR